MVKIPTEVYDNFFDSLVGDQSRVDALHQRMSFSVGDCSGDFDNPDPYERLQRGAELEISRSISTIKVPRSSEDHLIRRDVLANAEIGSLATVSALRLIADIYVERADVPQDPGTVSRNTDRAIRHLFGAAFAGKIKGNINLMGYFRGGNPRNPLFFPQLLLIGALAGHVEPGHSAKRTFTVSEDKAGQLDIRPRFQQLRSRDKRCPATFSSVEIDGRKKSGLFTFMKTIGDVGATEIFPNFFDIEQVG